MIVETPPILWNCEDDSKGTPAALTSIAMCESGIVDNNVNEPAHVLATAGSTNAINLWRLSFMDIEKAAALKPSLSNGSGPVSNGAISVNQLLSSAKIELLCSLTRHDGPVNAIKFSPDGLHLASGGESGAIIVWSVPVHRRANGNGRHHWTTVTGESDLVVKIAPRCCSEGVCDLSWSTDSKRILIGTIDHAVVCYEDESYDVNNGINSNKSNASSSPSQLTQVPSEWRVAYRNGMEHTHYVQGVSYDPLGVYFASMSCDRSVRILQRKPRKIKKVTNANNETSTLSMQDQITSNKIEMLPRAKLIKYRKTMGSDGSVISKQYLYTDETTLESFVRRLSWTVDGAFLITPSALWHDNANDRKSNVQYATLIFARHRFDEPYRVLPGLDKPSIAIRANPVLFEMPTVEPTENDKENESPQKTNKHQKLRYRSIFAVLTLDSVLIYDTHHLKPLSIIRGIHYANIVDAQWSADGHSLLVCSTDCYITIIRFAPGELGQVYVKPPAAPLVTSPAAPGQLSEQSIAEGKVTASVILSSASVTPEAMSTASTDLSPKSQQKLSSTKLFLPPCDPGPANVIIGPPTKKAKTRITPTLIAVADTSASKPLKRSAPESLTHTVDKLSLENEAMDDEEAKLANPVNKKQKKRIQPILLASPIK